MKTYFHSKFIQKLNFVSQFFQIVVFACLIAVAAAVSFEDRHAKTLTHSKTSEGGGAYQWEYESDNKIIAQEAGAGGVIAQGSVQWYAPEGDGIHLSYIADADGYRATGDHLPTSPPIPPAIQRALDYLKLHAPERPDEKL